MIPIKSAKINKIYKNNWLFETKDTSQSSLVKVSLNIGNKTGRNSSPNIPDKTSSDAALHFPR